MQVKTKISQKKPKLPPKIALSKKHSVTKATVKKQRNRLITTYLLMALVVLLGATCNSWLSKPRNGVLGYTTDVSVTNIVADTNAQRNSNGLPGLTQNNLLVQAAQNKANDMATRDYWSHNTPDGRTPWTFVSSVGYSYRTVGENLAYGFMSASDTLDGWMNSPGHRANILNTSYTEMGVGIANSPDYQNSGPQTIIVAMYASPYTVPPPPTTPPPAHTAGPIVPVPQPSTMNSTIASPSDQLPAPPEPVVPSTPTPPPTPVIKKTTTGNQSSSDAGAKIEPKQQSISRVQLVTAAPVAAWSTAFMSLLASAALVFVLVRHGFAWRRYIKNSEKFVVHHPLIDLGAVFIVVAAMVLIQTAGVIR